jgi:hypothetical protein
MLKTLLNLFRRDKKKLDISKSIFASTEIIEVEFYKHFIGDKVLYVGQTTQGIGRRFEQHAADYRKNPSKKPWMQFNPGQDYLRLDPNDLTKVKFKMTPYEAAVVELYEINANGGLRKGNSGLHNKSKPIGKTKFNHFKTNSNFNPCIFYA